ncbi:hypothetical protein DUI87_11510 [Hirundo rustica rustica]|uniref:Uncharacterized protein n=1 Tax=Hirundo rustica rustica TaxID=333673 RepID=A0A3M0KFM7_HIRRU|nr:hypothetical protein DUI87_11510 [Hirundo rustica rustica]
MFSTLSNVGIRGPALEDSRREQRERSVCFDRIRWHCQLYLVHPKCKGVTSNRMRENDLKFQQGRLRLGNKKKIFSERVVGHRNRRSGGITTPEVFRKCVDVVLGDVA